MMGVRWDNRRSISFDLSVSIGLVKDLSCPCWVEENMCKEYAAVINLINEIAISDVNEEDKMEVIRRISLNRLMEGGAAILAPVNRNHQRVIVGATQSNPLVRKILRVLVIS